MDCLPNRETVFCVIENWEESYFKVIRHFDIFTQELPTFTKALHSVKTGLTVNPYSKHVGQNNQFS